MCVTVGKGAIEVKFWHTHRLASGPSQLHRHDALVANPEARQLCHRLAGPQARHVRIAAIAPSGIWLQAAGRVCRSVRIEVLEELV